MIEWIIILLWKFCKYDYVPKIGSKWKFRCIDKKDPFNENLYTYTVVEIEGDYVRYLFNNKEYNSSSCHVVHFRLNYKEIR